MMATTKWIKVTFEDISNLKGGGTPSRKNTEYFGDFLDWVTPSDLLPIGGVHLLGPVKEGLSKEGLKNSSANVIPVNSVLFSSRASIGKIAVTNRGCATNQGFINFVPKKNKIATWFLAYLLAYETPNIVKLSGETTYKEISRKKIRQFKTKIPDDINEQRRIVARIKECLDRVDEVKNLKEKSLNDVKRLLDSFYHEVISDQKNYIPVGEVIMHTRNGRSIRQSNENPNGRTLTLSAVHDVELNHQQIKNVVLKKDVIEKFSFKKGDVFVSRSNTIDLVGLSSISEEDSKDILIYPDLLIKLVPNTNKILPKYLTYALRYPYSRQQIRSKSRGTSQSMVKISSSSLKEVLIPLPSLIDQEKLIQKFDKFRILVNTLKMTFNETDFNALRKSILQKAFSGEL